MGRKFVQSKNTNYISIKKTDMMYANYQPSFQYVAEQNGGNDYQYLNFDELSNRELLAITISTDDDCEDGNLSQADLILDHVKGDLNKLARLSLPELMEIKGLRYAKALALAAASTLLHQRNEGKPWKIHK